MYSYLFNYKLDNLNKSMFFWLIYYKFSLSLSLSLSLSVIYIYIYNNNK